MRTQVYGMVFMISVILSIGYYVTSRVQTDLNKFDRLMDKYEKSIR